MQRLGCFLQCGIHKLSAAERSVVESTKDICVSDILIVVDECSCENA